MLGTDCNNCGHHFERWHADPVRCVSTSMEQRTRLCDDCQKCWPETSDVVKEFAEVDA